MNFDLETILKLVLPAVFLVAWAINQIVNKEAEGALKRSQNPFGPRPGGLPPAPRPPARASNSARRPSPTEPQSIYPSERERDEEILIIKAESNRPASGSKNAGKRSSVRNRPTQPQIPRRSNAKVAREQAKTDVSQVLHPAQLHGLSTSPLTANLDGLASPSTGPSPGMIKAQALSYEQIRKALRDPMRVRESVVLNEILQPPIALRRRISPRSKPTDSGIRQTPQSQAKDPGTSH